MDLLCHTVLSSALSLQNQFENHSATFLSHCSSSGTCPICAGSAYSKVPQCLTNLSLSPPTPLSHPCTETSLYAIFCFWKINPLWALEVGVGNGLMGKKKDSSIFIKLPSQIWQICLITPAIFCIIKYSYKLVDSVEFVRFFCS